MNYQEIQKDLFKMDPSYSLAHCISRDAAMGAGIAKEFRKRYPRMGQHIRLYRPKIGDAVAYPRNEVSHIFNLITKEHFWEKPTYDSFRESIESLKKEVLENNVTKLAIPLLGAGLDRLNWKKNRVIIQEIFEDTDVEIVVCIWS